MQIINASKIKSAILILCCLSTCSFSQSETDSLLAVWNNASLPDTTRLNAMNRISSFYLFSNPDTSFYFSDKALQLAEKKGLKKYMAIALNTQGSSKYLIGNYPEAIKLYTASLTIKEEVGDKKGMAGPLNNIGNIYSDQSDYANAMNYYTQSLRIEEEAGNKKGIAGSLNNIGTIYEEQGDSEKAIEYYTKSLKIKEEIGDQKGVAYTLNNIGNIFTKQGKAALAMEYQMKSLKIREELGNKSDIAMSLTAVGSAYRISNELMKAAEYYEKSFLIQSEINDKKGMANSLGNLGSVYKQAGDLKKAIMFSQKALKLGEETGVLIRIKEAAETLYECYEKTGNYKGALEMHKLLSVAKDSIRSEDSRKSVIRQEMLYEFEKEKALEEKEHEKQLAIAAAQGQKQKAISYSIAAGLLLVLFFTFFIINRLRITRTQKRIIEHQKELVEEKQKEILDSINYAKRLQEAILPSDQFIKEHLPESFMFYKPKDIVAGDFYWSERKGDHVFIAAADCTGHGVPGALVSVVCSSALNRAVLEFGITDPGKILDKTRELVLETFARSDKDVKDGMDISLCRITKNGNTREVDIQWSGANNPLWYISGGKMEEITADKQAIGKTESPKPFTTHTIQLHKDDSLFLFTDGYADQFGGEKGKKYKYKPLKELLLKNHMFSPAKQREQLDIVFNAWKGNLEQVDDVCIIGIKI